MNDDPTPTGEKEWARKGPVATAERLARRKAYSKSMGATGRFLRIFGMK
jgi:hypothetical protein